MIHVGISGPIGSGKSTLAKQLKLYTDQNELLSAIIPFAGGVKELAALELMPNRVAAIINTLFDWGYSYNVAIRAAQAINAAMERYPSESGYKNRRLLQTIGTEIGRCILGDDAWIRRAQQLMRREMYDFVFSDDLRFDNEALAVDIHIGITVDTCIDIYQQRITMLGQAYTFSDHPSETSLHMIPTFTIPADFDAAQAFEMFLYLNEIRRLRIT